MKKWRVLCLVMCLFFCFVSCDTQKDVSTSDVSSTEQEEILPGGSYRFMGEIRKITEHYLEVYTDDENMRRTSDLFHVSFPEGVSADDFTVGDTVEIVFAGAIEELYPAQIKGTFSIALWNCGLEPEETIFSAKVIDIDGNAAAVRDIDSGEEFLVSLEAFPNIDIAVGDFVSIEYNVFEENNALNKIQNPTNIRFHKRATSSIQFDAVILEISEDRIRVLGTTEGYEREFTAIMKNGDEFEIGEAVRVSYLFRGEYTENHPVVMETATVKSLTPKTYYFNARIVKTYDNMFLVTGEDIGLGYVTFSSEVSFEGYQVGDYVNIGYRGGIAESFPAQAFGYELRYMTEEEIAEFYREVTIRGVCLGAENGVVWFADGEHEYLFYTEAFSALPMLKKGDEIEVVYDGIIIPASNGYEICFPIEIRVVSE